MTRAGKPRRQIIIVTHNANLVVNTDADHVILASCGRHRLGQLPEITYECGNLENPRIRRRVCEILEGGVSGRLKNVRGACVYHFSYLRTSFDQLLS